MTATLDLPMAYNLILAQFHNIFSRLWCLIELGVKKTTSVPLERDCLFDWKSL